MALFSLKCPNCGGSIQMDDSKKTGFCMYCGSDFQTKDEVQRILIQHSGSIEIDRKSEVANLLIRADEKANALIANTRITALEFQEQCGVIDDNYIEKILDIDAQNQKAIYIRNRMINEQNNRNKIEQREIEDENNRIQANLMRAEYARRKKKAMSTIGLCTIVILIALPFILIFRDIYHTVNIWTIMISIFISMCILLSILKSIARMMGK